MLIDCDTCAVRGQGCDDCVVTVLLGAPPGWRGSDPTVVPLTRRGAVEIHGSERGTTQASTRRAVGAGTATGDCEESVDDAPVVATSSGDIGHIDIGREAARPVVELDDVERQAVRALADFGLVPPLRHQDASTPEGRHVS